MRRTPSAPSAATLFAAVALAAPLAAQAPVVTPDGDPSVRDDTLYALSVDPADHPDEPYVLLLDDGIVRVEEDGRTTRTYRYVAQVLRPEAVEQWGENSFGYDSSRERLRLNWARVVDTDGTVISSEPVHDQESLAPVGESAPVYTDQKVRRVSLGGVRPGTIVDYSYTVETTEEVLPGDFTAGWSVHTGAPTLRSRYVVDVPAGWEPRIRERNLDFRRTERRANGRRVFTWARADVPKIEAEAYAAFEDNDVLMRIDLSGRTEWADVARWFADLSADRFALTPEVEASIDEVVEGAATRADSLRALHRWIAQDFRYVSLSLGIGGYRPRPPADVLRTQYGDCKDKATLFIAAARRMGVRALPVLLSSSGGVEEDMPSLYQFDHMIAAVERPEGGWDYLDLTSELTPYGQIVPGYQGEFGLLVHPDGRGETITFPAAGAGDNRETVTLVGRLADDGTFTGRWEKHAGGGLQYSLRAGLSERISEREREQLTRAVAGSVFDGAVGEGLEIFDGRDLAAEPRVALDVTIPELATPVGGGSWLVHVPLRSFDFSSLVAEIEAREEPRRFGVDAEAVLGPVELVQEMRMELPKGWHLRVPADVTAESVFGRYHAEYRQDGTQLTVRRTLSGTRGIHPPEAEAELIRWMREVSRDDATYILADRGSVK